MAAADWLDCAPYNRISDWLFLNANDGSNFFEFLDGFKNMLRLPIGSN